MQRTEIVAHRALETRLERVWHFLTRAVDDSSDEIEYVHQLRVFVRRATAALEIFDDWLPKRRGNWVRKQVKRVRKAAGPARDLDVLALDWSEHQHALPAGSAEVLLERARRARREAQRPIVESHAKLEKRFDKHVTKFLKRIAARDAAPASAERFGCLAHQSLGVWPNSIWPRRPTSMLTSRPCTRFASRASESATRWRFLPARSMPPFATNFTRWWPICKIAWAPSTIT